MHFFGFLHPGRSTYLFKSYKQKYRGDKTVLINNGSNRREQAPKDITDIEPVTLLWLIVSSKSGSGASANLEQSQELIGPRNSTKASMIARIKQQEALQ